MKKLSLKDRFFVDKRVIYWYNSISINNHKMKDFTAGAVLLRK